MTSTIETPVADLCTGEEAPLRYRYRLPGESGADERDQRLVESVGRCGLLEPPLVITDFNAAPPRSIVILGHRRIAAARAVGLETISVHLLRTESVSRGEIVNSWLEGARYGLARSELENILLIGKAVDFIGAGWEELTGEISAATGKTMNAEYIRLILRIRGMDDGILRALHEGAISTGDLLQLDSHPAIDAGDAATLLAGARMTRAEQREAIRLMLFLADKGIFIQETFTTNNNSDRIGPVDKLRAACYPSLSRDLSRIDDIIRAMRLPQYVTINAPKNLEGGSYKVAIRVRSLKNLVTALIKLQDASSLEKFEKLFEILKG